LWYINQGNYPWCAAATTYGQLGHLDYSLKGGSAQDFYADKKNLCSLHSLADNYNSDNKDLDIDLDQSFSHLRMLISLQNKDTNLYSEKNLPFDHACQLNSAAARRLQKEINQFDAKLLSPTPQYSFTYGDNTFSCSKKYYDKHNIQKRVKGLDFILAHLINNQVKEKCLIGKNKLKNFDLMLKNVVKDKKIQPFRIHRFVSTNPASFLNHLMREDKKTYRSPIQLDLCVEDIHQGENLATSANCDTSSHSVLFVGAGLDDQGSCKMKFANSWGNEKGKSFSLSPLEFYNATKKRLEHKDKRLKSIFIVPTKKWEDDSYHEVIAGVSTFQGRAEFVTKDGKSLFHKKAGKALYKNFKLEDGSSFTGRANTNDLGEIYFKEGKFTRADGSYRENLKGDMAKFHHYKVNDEETFTGMAKINSNNQIEFLHGLLQLSDGSSRDLDQNGFVVYKNYKINSNFRYTGTATIDEDYTIFFISGTLTNIQTKKKTVYKKKK